MTLVGIRGGDSTARATLTSSLIGELRARDLRVVLGATAKPCRWKCKALLFPPFCPLSLNLSVFPQMAS
jgi:hypothetical protein